MRQLLVFFFLTTSLFAKSPEKIPPELYDAFTLDRQVSVEKWYIDESRPHPTIYVFETNKINYFINEANQRKMGYYGETDAFLFTLLDKYPHFIKDKTVGVVGSMLPWYESIVLAFNGEPITVEYNTITCLDDRIKVMTVAEYEKNPIKFDAVISISSIEHDGLGRYGDSINPWGDIQAMGKIKNMLKEDGVLFLAVPVGTDTLVWNAHRIYGKLRLPLLLAGWQVIDSCGFSETFSGCNQPVFLLKP